jgi:hypothetical protein
VHTADFENVNRATHLFEKAIGCLVENVGLNPSLQKLVGCNSQKNSRVRPQTPSVLLP